MTAFAPAHTSDANVGTSFSPTNSITAGHAYTIALVAFASTLTSISANNGDGTLTKVVTQVNTSNDVICGLFVCLSSAGGTPTFTITSGGTTGYLYTEWNQQAGSVRGSNSGTGTGTSESSGSTTVNTGDVAVGVLGSSGDTYTNYPTTGWTDLVSAIPTIQNVEYLPVASNGTATATATISATENWVAAIMALTPATAQDATVTLQHSRTDVLIHP